MTPVIKLTRLSQNVVPKPYTDTTYVIPEGIYALPDVDQLVDALIAAYAQQGLEVINFKPAEITLRKYHDNTPSNQPGKEVPQGGDSGQPADL